MRFLHKKVNLRKRRPSPRVAEAKVAAQEAGQRLSETKDCWPEIQRRAERLAEIRSQNHFADIIRTHVLGG